MRRRLIRGHKARVEADYVQTEIGVVLGVLVQRVVYFVYAEVVVVCRFVKAYAGSRPAAVVPEYQHVPVRRERFVRPRYVVVKRLLVAHAAPADVLQIVEAAVLYAEAVDRVGR